MRFVLVTCAVLLTSCGAHTAETAPANAAQAAAQIPAEFAPAVRAYVDPVTGALREPTAEELKASAPPVTTGTGVARPAEPLPQRVQPDGTVIMDLGPAQMNELCAHTTSSGTVVEEHCTLGERAK